MMAADLPIKVSGFTGRRRLGDTRGPIKLGSLGTEGLGGMDACIALENKRLAT